MSSSTGAKNKINNTNITEWAPIKVNHKKAPNLFYIFICIKL